MSRPFQDSANSPLIACLQQLRDLRRVAFVLTQNWSLCDRYITDLQKFIQDHSLRLESIYLRRNNGEGYWFRRYTKQINSRGDLLSWRADHFILERLEFVDRW